MFGYFFSFFLIIHMGKENIRGFIIRNTSTVYTINSSIFWKYINLSRIIFVYFNYLVSVNAGGLEIHEGTCNQVPQYRLRLVRSVREHPKLLVYEFYWKIVMLWVYNNPFGFKQFRRNVFFTSFGKGLLTRVHYPKWVYDPCSLFNLFILNCVFILIKVSILNSQRLLTSAL